MKGHAFPVAGVPTPDGRPPMIVSPNQYAVWLAAGVDMRWVRVWQEIPTLDAPPQISA